MWLKGDDYMLNEIEEFKAYTGKVSYTAKNKYDSTYLGRFTFDMLMNDIGLARVLTIIARGYMWGNDEPDLERAKNALCAWCSVSGMKKDLPKKTGQSETNYSFLNSEFPELVDKSGTGWYLKHVRKVISFVKKNESLVSKSAIKNCKRLSEGFKKHWKDKLMQFQVPLFSAGTKGAWIIRFDDILADALELGPLKNMDFELSDKMAEKLSETDIKGVPDYVLPVLVKYYLANRQEDSDWVVLPVTNFDAYFGTTSFSRKWLPAIPKTIIDKPDTRYGVSRYRVNNDYI